MRSKTVCYGLSIVLLLMLCLFVASCRSDIASDVSSDSTFTVVTTFFPLTEMARALAYDPSSVYSLIPPNVEPHDYEPTPSDLIRLKNTDLYFTLGIPLSASEESFIETLPPTTPVVSVSSSVSLLPFEDGLVDERDSEEHEDEGVIDPHFWLSPKRMVVVVQTMRDAYIAADPIHTAWYHNQSLAQVSQLSALDLAYQEGLSHCALDTIFVTHNAYQYLADEYGFTVVSLSGLSPEVEPTPSELQNLIEEARTLNVSVLFSEELVDPRTAEALAEELGLEVLLLSPIEGTTDESATYVTLMYQNLDRLKYAMGCTP